MKMMFVCILFEVLPKTRVQPSLFHAMTRGNNKSIKNNKSYYSNLAKEEYSNQRI